MNSRIKVFRPEFSGRLILSGIAMGVWALAGLMLAGEAPYKSGAAPDIEKCRKCHLPGSSVKWHSLARYRGAENCRICHAGDATGDAYGTWTSSKHAKAYESLASDTAKRLAGELGIADPQTNARCLKCHSSAPEVAAKQLDAKFDRTLGVQCEACHGAAGKHLKKRVAAAASATNSLPTAPKLAEEIRKGDAQLCLECHNKDCPAFKAFCVNKRWAEIRHPDPRKKLGEGNTFAACPCGTEQCVCAKGECPGP